MFLIGNIKVAEYGTFKMANNIAFNKLNAPDLVMIVAGAIISAIGTLFAKFKKMWFVTEFGDISFNSDV